MKQAVLLLRAHDYAVDVARTVKEVQSKIRTKHYDLAIIDLAWWADKDSIPYGDSDYYGYDICEEIEKIDKETGKTTSIIIYSSRFKEEAGISTTAASKGRLPVYKIYDKIGHEALRATVKFIETLIKRAAPSEIEILLRKKLDDLYHKEMELLDVPRLQQKKWFTLTIVCVALSIGLLLAGAAGVILWNFEIGVLTSISSVLSGAISALLFSQLRKAQKTFDTSLENVKALRKNTFEELKKEIARKTKPK